MLGSRRKRLPYQVTRGGLLVVGTACILSLGLFWYGVEGFEAPATRAMGIDVPVSRTNSGSWWAIFAGASLLGGALGAAIGQVFRDEKGGIASMAAFIGALAGPPIVVLLFLAVLFVDCLLYGWPT